MFDLIIIISTLIIVIVTLISVGISEFKISLKNLNKILSIDENIERKPSNSHS